MTDRLRVGVVGCGAIAPAYLRNLTGPFSHLVEVVACSDLVENLARSRAREFGIRDILRTDELLAREDIDVVLNLTPATAHYQVSRTIIEAGKHMFTEKPLCLTLEQGREILDTAKAKGLTIAGAADTFLGAGLQVSRRLIVDGRLGDLVCASAIVSLPMFDSQRYHHVFGGSVLDMGPYYITALIQLMGPVVGVTAAAPLRFSTRADGKSGEPFEIPRPATAAATLTFASEAVATILFSHDVSGYFPHIEVFGRKARLITNDANALTGALALYASGGKETIEPTAADGFIGTGRGLGVADMALAFRDGREPRANADLLHHVFEIQCGIFTAAGTGQSVPIHTRVEPAALFTAEENAELFKNQEAPASS